MATNTPFKNIHLLTEAQYEAETKSSNDIYAVEVPAIDLTKTIGASSTDSEIPTAKSVNDAIVNQATFQLEFVYDDDTTATATIKGTLV